MAGGPDSSSRRGAAASVDDSAGQHPVELDQPDADADADATVRRHDEIETAVPAGERVRASMLQLWTTARASVPLRTILFLLPPLVVPLVAFDLTVGAALGVTLLLLWLAVAAAAIATMMFDGSDHLVLRAIERRLDSLSASTPAVDRSVDDDALLAVGAQLDALNDRLDQLTGAATRSR